MQQDIEYYGKRINLYHISKYILGYDRLDPIIHRKWCDDLTENRQKYNRMLILKPRGCFKSTIYSVSFVIEILMRDFLENHRFTKRILIASATDDLATQLLGEIVQHLQTNEELRSFFGRDILAGVNQQSVTLTPRSVHKEPNIKARGSGSAIVGEHYDIIIADDIVNQDDRESKAKREKNFRWMQDLISIIEPKGFILIVGTRWHLADLYGSLIENNDKLSDKFKYHIEISSATDKDGNPNYPTILPLDVLESLKIEKGQIEYASQYENNPLGAGTQIFSMERMHFYTDYGASSSMYDNCKTIAYLDPALGRDGDYIVLAVGTVMDGDLLIRDAVMSNSMHIENFLHVVSNYHTMYNFSPCFCETNGFQLLIANSLRDMNIPVKDVGNRKKKEIRIESIEPFFSSGRIKFREDWKDVYPEFVNQILSFPVHRHDDAPDALAGLAHAALFNNKQTSAYVDFVKNLNVTTPKFQGKELNPRLRLKIKRKFL